MKAASLVDDGRWPLRVVLVAMVAGVALACAAPALGTDRKEHVPQIRVVGTASVTSPPDRVSVDVSVITRAEGAQAAAEQNATETSSVVAKLREAFVDSAELSTSGYSLQPDYVYDKQEGRRRQTGFTARNTVRVVITDVGQAGALIDAAVAAGANEVRSVRFGVSVTEPLEQQALIDAAADARRKAEALAASTGAKLGRTLRVEERGSRSPQPHGAMMVKGRGEQTPVEPSDVYFEAAVELWVELVEK